MKSAELVEKRRALKMLIEKRKAFEKLNPIEPYVSHPTTIDFKDIDGNTLLHYDCMLGDMQAVMANLAEKSDINIKSEDGETPIECSLWNDHLEIAAHLYNKGASCQQTHIQSCGSERTREWFRGVAKSAIRNAFPELDRITKPIKTNQFFNETANEYDVLALACEVGDIDFLKEVNRLTPCVLSGVIKYIPLDHHDNYKLFCCLLRIATKAKQTEIVKWLLLNGAVLNSIHSYKGSALIDAVCENDNTLVDLFLGQCADVNVYDQFKENVLFKAVRNENLDLIKKLIVNGANLESENIEGDNLLHCAVLSGNLACLKYLLSLSNMKCKLLETNIYGMTPLDYALYKKFDSIIEFLDPNWKVTEGENPKYGKHPIKIPQELLRKKFKFFNRSQYGDCEFLGIGSCHGLGFFSEWCAYLKKTYQIPGLTQILAQISLWGGDILELENPLETLVFPQVKTLKDLFYYLISTINIFQANALNEEIFTDNPIDQTERERQFTLIADPKYSLSYLYQVEKLRMCYHLPSYRSEKAIKELLTYLNKLPPGIRFEFLSNGHTTSGHVDDKNCLYWYDSNTLYEMSSCKDAETLLNRLISLQYIALGVYKRLLFFSISIFYFGAKPDMSKVRLFKDIELPDNITSLLAFQNESPNNFTPLHIAVIFQSLYDLDLILSSKYYSLELPDAMGMTPIDYSLLSGNHEMTSKLLAKAQYNLQGNNASIIFVYKNGDYEFVYSIVGIPKLIGFESLLAYACLQSDLILIEKLINEKKVNLTPYYKKYETVPLVLALQKGDFLIIQLLIQAGADVLECGNDKVSALHYAIQYKCYQDYLIDQMADINAKDRNGNTSQHFAAMYGDFNLMKQLTLKGARADITNAEGKCALGLFLSTSLRDNKIKREACDYYLNDSTFVPSQSLLQTLINTSYLLSTKSFELLLRRHLLPMINERFLHGKSLLYEAISRDQLKRVEILLKAGASATVDCYDGKPPLIVAIDNYSECESNLKISYEIIKALLNAGADPFQCDNNGQNAYQQLDRVPLEGKQTLQDLLNQCIHEDKAKRGIRP